MPKVRGVLWDVDGTLSDSSTLGYTSTMKVLQNYGNIRITEEEYHDGTRYTTPHRFAWHVTGDPEDSIGEILGKQFDELYVDLVSTETAGLYPGIRELLTSFCKNHGEYMQMGALSNACGNYVRAVLKANQIDLLFQVQLGADEVPAPKPQPDGLQQCCKSLNLNPCQCVYIGDSPTDGLAATAAGMFAIGVSWGSHPIAKLKETFPIVVDTVHDLNAELERFIEEQEYDEEK